MRSRGAVSIRTRLISTYLVVLLVPSILIGVISYSTASSRIRDQLMTSAKDSVNSANTIVARSIQSKLYDLDYYTSGLTSDKINEEVEMQGTDIQGKLNEYRAIHPDVLNMYIGTSRGNTVYSSDEKLASDYDPRSNPWYVQALKTDKAVISPAYKGTDGRSVVSISKILGDGKAVMSLELDLTAISEMTRQKVGKEGYIVILDSSKKTIVHPTAPIGEESAEPFVQGMYEQDEGMVDYSTKGQSYTMIFMRNDETGWRIGGTMSQDEVASETAAIRLTVIGVVLSSVLTAGILIILNIRSIIRPLKRLKEATAVLGQGNLTERLDSFRQDEIGELASNFQVMVDNLRNMIEGVREMTDSVSISAGELSVSAEQTTRSIEDVTMSIQEVATGSEQQLQSVEGSMDSVHNVTRKVDHITGHMQQVALMMTGTADSAHEGNTAISSAEQKINDIHEAVNELSSVIESLMSRTEHIGGIVNVMTEIAQQTNLLALNASIEAARAGEHGSGFAVVASEVRKLAEGSEQSAGQIKGMIQHIQTEMSQTEQTMKEVRGKVKEGIEAVDISGKSFHTIRESVVSAEDMIQSAAHTMHEIALEAADVEQRIVAIRTISEKAAESTETISAAAEEQLASSEEIASSTADLSRLAEQLQSLVAKFKTQQD